MGLIILFLVGLIICSVLVYIASEILCSDICECVGSIALFGAVVFGLAFLISVGLAFMSNVGYDGFIASNKAIYDSLTYQLENDLYDNDNDLGKKELYNQIQEWNKDLATGKAMTHDPWLGIFWIDAYDEFDFIELE